jgi:predicted transposase YdaD
MQQSVIYQAWIEEGRAEGRLDGERSLILRQLARCIGDVKPEMRTKIQSLSLPKLETLVQLGLLQPSCTSTRWRRFLYHCVKMMESPSQF